MPQGPDITVRPFSVDVRLKYQRILGKLPTFHEHFFIDKGEPNGQETF